MNKQNTKRIQRICCSENCDRPVVKLGRCTPHYRQMSSSDVSKVQGLSQEKRRLIYADIKNKRGSERQRSYEYTNPEGEAELHRRCTAAKSAAQKAQEV